MYYVYVLVQESSGNRYIGFSSDLRKRLEQHNRGRGSTYTKRGDKWQLVYYEAFVSKEDAMLRERKLKHDGRAKYQLFRRIERSLAGQK
jgi:putative endonuclease